MADWTQKFNFCLIGSPAADYICTWNIHDSARRRRSQKCMNRSSQANASKHLLRVIFFSPEFFSFFLIFSSIYLNTELQCTICRLACSLQIHLFSPSSQLASISRYCQENVNLSLCENFKPGRNVWNYFKIVRPPEENIPWIIAHDFSKFFKRSNALASYVMNYLTKKRK